MSKKSDILLMVHINKIAHRLSAPAGHSQPQNAKYVWIFGPSSVGKKTLIQDIARNEERVAGSVLKQLGISRGETFVPVVLKLQIANRKRFQRLMVLRKRVKQFRYLYNLDVKATWLIHGQRCDLIDHLVKPLPRNKEGKLVRSVAVYMDISEEAYNARKRVQALSTHAQAYADREEILEKLEREFSDVQIIET